MKKLVYPDWVEKFRTKGRTIRKVKNGYALYSCTSVYVKGSYPKSVQTYLGMITEEDGFIPKGSSIATHQFIEYGLSYILWLNFKRDLIRASYGGDEITARLGVIYYLFHSLDPSLIRSTYLANEIEDTLITRAKNTNLRRLVTIANKVEYLLKQSIPEEEERNLLKSLLMLCVIDKSNSSLIRPILSIQIKEILERNGLKYE